MVGLGDDFVAEQLIFGGAINVTNQVRTGTPIIAVRSRMRSRCRNSGTGAATSSSLSVSPAISDQAKMAKVLERVVQQRGEYGQS